MTRVLLIGIQPDQVDLSDPFFPAELTHEKISAGIAETLADMRGRGWEAEFCSIQVGSVEADVASSLSNKWDCIVLGAGVRVPPKNLIVFEEAVNTVIRIAPGTPIAFNTRPQDSADAAARRLT